MWPAKLFHSSSSLHIGAPQPDGATQLLQWTILIGSLLAVVLLIALIARKLVAKAAPSYHWLLAKHTLKTVNKLSPPDGGGGAAALCNCDTCASAPAQHQLAHHRCVASYCAAPSDSLLRHAHKRRACAAPHPHSGGRQFATTASVDSASGAHRHELARAGTLFNTDSSLSCQTFNARTNLHQNVRTSLAMQNEYDVPNGDDSIRHTRVVVAYDNATKSTCVLAPQRNKHTSPQVSSAASSSSSSSSCGGGDDDYDARDLMSRTNSVQSSTAPMLSSSQGGASSSFDQSEPNELSGGSVVNCAVASPALTGVVVASQSAHASPQQHVRRPSASKPFADATGVALASQSQPNSPMLSAGQFAAQRQKQRRRKVIAPKLVAKNYKDAHQQRDDNTHAPQRRVQQLARRFQSIAASHHPPLPSTQPPSTHRNCDNKAGNGANLADDDRHHYEEINGTQIVRRE